MKGEKKKVAIILLFGVLLFGTLLWWLLSPIISFHASKLASEDGVNVNPFAGDLASGDEATQREQDYLDEINEPVDIITDADEGSLALIKRGDYGKKKDEVTGKDDSRDKDRDKREPRPSKVKSVDKLKQAMVGKLGKMSLGGLGGGGGGRGGYSSGDLNKWRGRFASGSDFKGGNVATGPAAKTKVGKGSRSSPDSKMEKLAASAAQKFGEGGTGKQTSDQAKALKDLASAIPADLKTKDAKGPEKVDSPTDYKSDGDDTDDPCDGVKPIDPSDALAQMFTNILVGFGMSMIGYAAGGGLSGGNNEQQQRDLQGQQSDAQSSLDNANTRLSDLSQDKASMMSDSTLTTEQKQQKSAEYDAQITAARADRDRANSRLQDIGRQLQGLGQAGQSGGGGIGSQIGSSLSSSGVSMITNGITSGLAGLLDPDKPLRDCKLGGGGSSSGGGLFSGSGGSQ